MKLSVIIPMYNEKKLVSYTVAKLRDFADAHAEFEFELVFVNDGSTDNCFQSALNAAGDDCRFRIIGYDVNHGKGYAVRYGMLKATGDVRVFTDCDLAYGTEAVAQIAHTMLEQKSDLCIGSRNLSPEGYEGYTLMRRIMSKIYIKVLSVAAGFRHSDSQSGIKCFSARAADDVFSRCEIDRFAFDLEALMIAERLGYSISEMPVRVINHRESESKVHPVRDTLRMLRDIKRIKKKLRGSDYKTVYR